MNTIDCLFSRKSIRNFTGERISEDDLNTILRVTDTSPVGRSRYDNLHLTIIERSDLLKAIDEHTAIVFGNPDLHPLYGAPTFIIVSAINDEGYMGNVQYSNAAIMVHTMSMAAVDLGIGHCDIWGAVNFMTDNIKEQLEIPEGFTPCCGIILGKTEIKYKKRNFPTNRVTHNFVK